MMHGSYNVKLGIVTEAGDQQILTQTPEMSTSTIRATIMWITLCNNAPPADNYLRIFHPRNSTFTSHMSSSCYVIMYSRAATEVKIKVARINTSKTSIFLAQLSCARTTRLCRPPCYESLTDDLSFLSQQVKYLRGRWRNRPFIVVAHCCSIVPSSVSLDPVPAGKHRTHCELHWINHLKMNDILLYLKTQFVPRSKHFSSRL